MGNDARHVLRRISVEDAQAAAILALNDAALGQRLAAWRQAQTDAVALAPSDDLP